MLEGCQPPSSRHLGHVRELVDGRRSEEGARRVERQMLDVRLVNSECLKQLAGVSPPDPDRGVKASGCDQRSVSTDRNATHRGHECLRAVMRHAQRPELLAGLRVPDLRHAAQCRADEELSVFRIRHIAIPQGVDGVVGPFRVAVDAHVPDDGGAIGAYRDDAISGGAESRIPQRGVVAAQNHRHHAVLDCAQPNAHRTVVAGRHDVTVVRAPVGGPDRRLMPAQRSDHVSRVVPHLRELLADRDEAPAVVTPGDLSDPELDAGRQRLAEVTRRDVVNIDLSMEERDRDPGSIRAEPRRGLEVETEIGLEAADGEDLVASGYVPHVDPGLLSFVPDCRQRPAVCAR